MSNDDKEIVHGQPRSEDDPVLAMCTDCLSTIPDKMAEKDVFLQSGKNGVCKFCGGPLIVTYKSEVKNIRRKRAGGGQSLL